VELVKIKKLIWLEGVSLLVVGYPRNQQGEATKQTAFVERFIDTLQQDGEFHTDVVFQDESLTSVLAEQYLESTGKPYGKADIDAHAARIILQDYIEEQYG
jgi:putative Holliday junction resolvase